MVLDSGDCGSVMLRLTPMLRPGTPMATLVLLVWDMAMVVLTPQLPLLAQLLLLPLSALLLPMATLLDWLDTDMGLDSGVCGRLYNQKSYFEEFKFEKKSIRNCINSYQASLSKTRSFECQSAKYMQRISFQKKKIYKKLYK